MRDDSTKQPIYKWYNLTRELRDKMQETDLPMEVEATSPDFKTELAAKLQELVPEAITDGKVDTQKLKELLDSDSADDSERFGLFWPGKKRAIRAAQDPTTATLKPAKDESKDWDTTENLFIEGDNLEVLKVLQKHYHNKIKMIYIDPPYNTGKDFVYPDNYKEGLASYLEFTNQVDNEGRKVSTNSDTDGRYHSNWLNMMYPRLKLARNLLSDDGVIFISIDDNEQAHLRKLCDEVFGEGNFITDAIWRSKDNSNNDAKKFSIDHNHTLIYSRNNDWQPARISDPLKQTHFKNPDNDPKGPYFDGNPLNSPNYRANLIYDLTSPQGTIISPPKNGWRWSKDALEQKIASGEIRFTEDGRNIRRRTYLSDIQGLPPSSLWIDLENTGHNRQAKYELLKLIPEDLFDTPKPTKLIKYMIKLANLNDGDIVLDFFSGSGTTAHAVMQINAEDGINRKHIQVQLPEPTDEKSEAYKFGYKTISAIAEERIRRAAEKIKADYADKILERDTPLDSGFRVYKLSDTNFTKWRSASDTDKDMVQQQLLEIRESSNDAASEEDLLTEVLLKQGISLTAPLKHIEIEDLSTWIVGENVVAAYLNEHNKPSIDQLRAVVATEPAKFIILEDAFQGDDELKTNLVQICKSQKIELWTV